MRNALAHAGKSGRRVVSAFIATAFAQDTSKAASQQWRNVADQIRPKVPKRSGQCGFHKVPDSDFIKSQTEVVSDLSRFS